MKHYSQAAVERAVKNRKLSLARLCCRNCFSSYNPSFSSFITLQESYL